MTPPAFPAAAVDALRDAAKAFLRIEGDGEDAPIGEIAACVLALGEAFTGSAWIAREWEEVLPAARGWQRLTMAPVTSITAVLGVPPAGEPAALPTESYAIDIDAQGQGWVRVTAPGDAKRVRVAYGAGAAAGWGDLPPPLRQGAVLLVAHLFGNRAREAAPPAAVSALWRPWRVPRLAAAVHA